MENNKFEKIVFILLKLFGVLSIIGAFLSKDGFWGKQELLIYNHKSLIGNVYFIQPRIIVEMVVSILIYLIFIRFVAKHISIAKKSI